MWWILVQMAVVFIVSLVLLRLVIRWIVGPPVDARDLRRRAREERWTHGPTGGV